VRLRRVSAGFGLVVYVTAALVYPGLHRLHHARFGADHVHGALGTVRLDDDNDDNADAATVFDHHRAFDLEWQALDLADVAHAGTLTVDCELAAYSGVDCSAARPDHAHNFGDELLARQHHAHRHAPDVDPEHGAGSFEHLRASLLTSLPIALPPPSSPARFALDTARPVAPSLPSRRQPSSRGPPRAG
jgi:hypothetical protein